MDFDVYFNQLQSKSKREELETNQQGQNKKRTSCWLLKPDIHKT